SRAPCWQKTRLLPRPRRSLPDWVCRAPKDLARDGEASSEGAYESHRGTNFPGRRGAKIRAHLLLDTQNMAAELKTSLGGSRDSLGRDAPPPCQKKQDALARRVMLRFPAARPHDPRC